MKCMSSRNLNTFQGSHMLSLLLSGFDFRFVLQRCVHISSNKTVQSRSGVGEGDSSPAMSGKLSWWLAQMLFLADHILSLQVDWLMEILKYRYMQDIHKNNY